MYDNYKTKDIRVKAMKFDLGMEDGFFHHKRYYQDAKDVPECACKCHPEPVIKVEGGYQKIVLGDYVVLSTEVVKDVDGNTIEKEVKKNMSAKEFETWFELENRKAVKNG